MKELYRGIIHNNCILFNANDLEKSCFKNDDEVYVSYDNENQCFIIESIEEKSKQWIEKYCNNNIFKKLHYNISYINDIMVVIFCDINYTINTVYTKIENKSREERQRGLAICVAKSFNEEIPPYIKQLE